jgi:hypothetical protein
LIVFEVRTILSAYFLPHEDQAIRDSQLGWWCDELHDWEIEQIVWSLRKWNRDEPRKRPTPGDIVRILKDQRGKSEAARMPKAEPQPERKPATKEEAADVLKAAGVRVDENGRVVL